MSRVGRERFALILLSLGAFCIALSPILVRLSELGPTATAWQRMLLVLPIYAMWLMLPNQRTDGPGESSGHRHLWLWVAGLAFAADLVCWHWSINYTTVANATLLANCAPIFVSLAAWYFFGERIGLGFVVGLLMAIIGAALLVRASANIGGGYLFGDALGMLTAIFYAAYLVAVKRLQYCGMSNARIMLYSSAISVLALTLMAWSSGESLWAQTWRGWLVLLVLAWVSQGLGQGLITYGLSHLPASYASVNLLLQPVGAALLAWALLGEDMDGWQLFGAGIVLSGIIVARLAISTSAPVSLAEKS